ncbi:transcription regulator protein BACH1b [Stigmatopora argus]
MPSYTYACAAHSGRVLERLDELRLRGLLCDVTVQVDGRRFHAHRAVLASCSDYFAVRLHRHDDDVILPPEVTAGGFEPLLTFAYTSELLFGKHDILEIRQAASSLGFRDLDHGCFDFLLPKFSSDLPSLPSRRKKCCIKKEKSEKEEVDGKSVSREAALPSFLEGNGKRTTFSSGPAGVAGGPKYRKFQLACGKETPQKNPECQETFGEEKQTPGIKFNVGPDLDTEIARRGDATDPPVTVNSDSDSVDKCSRSESGFLKKDTFSDDEEHPRRRISDGPKLVRVTKQKAEGHKDLDRLPGKGREDSEPGIRFSGGPELVAGATCKDKDPGILREGQSEEEISANCGVEDHRSVCSAQKPIVEDRDKGPETIFCVGPAPEFNASQKCKDVDSGLGSNSIPSYQEQRSRMRFPVNTNLIEVATQNAEISRSQCRARNLRCDASSSYQKPLTKDETIFSGDPEQVPGVIWKHQVLDSPKDSRHGNSFESHQNLKKRGTGMVLFVDPDLVAGSTWDVNTPGTSSGFKSTDVCPWSNSGTFDEDTSAKDDKHRPWKNLSCPTQKVEGLGGGLSEEGACFRGNDIRDNLVTYSGSDAAQFHENITEREEVPATRFPTIPDLVPGVSLKSEALGPAQPGPSHQNRVSVDLNGPFLAPDQDPEQGTPLWKGGTLSESEGASQSGFSSFNSGEDGDSETDGDRDWCPRERARQVDLPFSVDFVIRMNRLDLQNMLGQHTLTRQQLDLIHDVRRRGKNRLAAQRCRKRKLECIANLQEEIDKLKCEREKLLEEQNHLRHLKTSTRLGVMALKRRVYYSEGQELDPRCPLISYMDALPLTDTSSGADETQEWSQDM